MWKRMLVALLPKIWQDGMKSVEKQNLVLKAMEVCWKNDILRKTWPSFTNSVQSWLKDAIDEVQQARKWYEER